MANGETAQIQVIRIGALLLMLLIAPAHAQPVAAAGGFDPHLVTNVYATALAFMAPRTLEPVPVSQLTIWGLHGLSALDPDLNAGLSGGQLQLAAKDHILLTQPPPADNDVDGWAAAAARMASVAVAVSVPVRRASTQGVVQSFFDELFNHLDPYSRYVPPGDAAEDRERRSGDAGAGLRLVQRGSAIIVAEAITDGPGALAGIRPGDSIVAVDGQPARGVDAPTVMSWIAGPDGTSVVVAWRDRGGRMRSAELERAMVPPETVVSQRVGDLLLIQISAFNHSTDDHLARAIEHSIAGTHPPDGIVLDLRGDRGGLLRQAVQRPTCCCQRALLRSPPDATPRRHGSGARHSELAQDVPVVVLVDGRHRQRRGNHGRVTRGSRPWRGDRKRDLGKGLVQTIAPLPDGGELFVTWSRVLARWAGPSKASACCRRSARAAGEDARWRCTRSAGAGRAPMAEVLARVRPPVPHWSRHGSWRSAIIVRPPKGVTRTWT